MENVLDSLKNRQSLIDSNSAAAPAQERAEDNGNKS